MPNKKQNYEEDEARWSGLMVSAQQGNKDAYHELLSQLGNVIEAYLRIRFGNIDMLEDCVQECLITIHKARDTYNPKRQFRPWMFTLVRHCMIDQLRKKNCRIRMTEQLGEDNNLDLHNPVHIQRIIDGIRVLEWLKPDYREAITLIKYIGMTTNEAADWLGISEHAVKARLRRGLLMIHRKLNLEDSLA